MVGRPDRWGETRLVAYVVGEASPAALRGQLGRTLPASMVPSAFVRHRFPAAQPNGKIDRDALPDPEPTRSGAHPPRDRLELCLAAIWEDVLKLRPVGIRDDFFELGGDSILALELVSQVESVCGLRLPISALLEAPTVARQAEILRDASWSPAWPAIVALQPHGDRPGFFCAAGAGTDVLSLAELPRHLGHDQPFYGLQPPGQDGQRAPLGTVDSLAAYFVREMRADAAARTVFPGRIVVRRYRGVRDGATARTRAARGGRPAGAVRHARARISERYAATRRRDFICSAGSATLFRSRRSADGPRCAARCSSSGRSA